MALHIEKGGSGPMYRSDKRLLLTADGKIVGPDDPAGVTLLVAEGGELPYAEAMKYGLVPDRHAAPAKEDAKKAEALPLPTSAATVEKAADVLPKGVGTETKAPAKDATTKDKPEKKQ